MNFDTAIKEGKIRMNTLEQMHVIIIGLTVSSYKTHHFETQCTSSTNMATIREDNCSLSRTSRHLAVVTASGAQKYKMSLQRHSSVPMLSFDTDEEELNIATSADSSISTKFVFHNKRQSLLFPYPVNKQTKTLRPS